MSQSSPLWGAPEIHGELPKLGIDVHFALVHAELRTDQPDLEDSAAPVIRKSQRAGTLVSTPRPLHNCK
jgi:hypothetical protein